MNVKNWRPQSARRAHHFGHHLSPNGVGFGVSWTGNSLLSGCRETPPDEIVKMKKKFQHKTYEL